MFVFVVNSIMLLKVKPDGPVYEVWFTSQLIAVADGAETVAKTQLRTNTATQPFVSAVVSDTVASSVKCNTRPVVSGVPLVDNTRPVVSGVPLVDNTRPVNTRPVVSGVPLVDNTHPVVSGVPLVDNTRPVVIGVPLVNNRRGQTIENVAGFIDSTRVLKSNTGCTQQIRTSPLMFHHGQSVSDGVLKCSAVANTAGHGSRAAADSKTLKDFVVPGSTACSDVDRW